MTKLERLLLLRADEQVSQVDFKGGRDMYGGRCRWDGCLTLIAYWNKTQLCTSHGNLFRKNERNRLRREYLGVVKKLGKPQSGCATRERQGPSFP